MPPTLHVPSRRPSSQSLHSEPPTTTTSPTTTAASTALSSFKAATHPNAPHHNSSSDRHDPAAATASMTATTAADSRAAMPPLPAAPTGTNHLRGSSHRGGVPTDAATTTTMTLPAIHIASAASPPPQQQQQALVSIDRVIVATCENKGHLHAFLADLLLRLAPGPAGSSPLGVPSVPAAFLSHPVIARFCSRHPPPISIADYSKRLVNYLHCSPVAFPIAITYLLRASQALFRIHDRSVAAVGRPRGAASSSGELAPLPLAAGNINHVAAHLARFARRSNAVVPYGSSHSLGIAAQPPHHLHAIGMTGSASSNPSFNVSFAGANSVAVSREAALAEQDRLQRSLAGAFSIHPLCAHRLLLAACVLAVKYIDDVFLPTKFYADVGGVSALDLANLEWGLFELLDSDAFVEESCVRAAATLL